MSLEVFVGGWEHCEVWEVCEVYGQCRRFMQAWRDGGLRRVGRESLGDIWYGDHGVDVMRVESSLG